MALVWLQSLPIERVVLPLEVSTGLAAYLLKAENVDGQLAISNCGFSDINSLEFFREAKHIVLTFQASSLSADFLSLPRQSGALFLQSTFQIFSKHSTP
jgi:hypothetical protein